MQSGTIMCFSATSFVGEFSDETLSGPMFHLFMHPAVITALNMTTIYKVGKYSRLFLSA